MQRMATRLTTLGLLVLFVGCAQQKPAAPADASAVDDAAWASIYAADDGADDYASDGQYVAYAGADEPAAPAASASRMHTVARGDTLYGLARTYYNDQRQWRAIYEANRAQVSDPNRLRVGQQLVIP